MNGTQNSNSRDEVIEKLVNAIYDMQRKLDAMPATMKEYIYLPVGQHCECCSKVKKVVKSNGTSAITSRSGYITGTFLFYFTL